VSQGELLGHRSKTGGEFVQILPILTRQLLARPEDGLTGVGVEIRDVELAQDSPIVVSDQTAIPRKLTQALDTAVRIRSIAQDIAETPDFAHSVIAEVSQDGIEGSEIAMDIGYDRVTHLDALPRFVVALSYHTFDFFASGGE